MRTFAEGGSFFLVVDFLGVIIVVIIIFVVIRIVIVVLIFVFVQFGDDVDMDRVRLNNFEFRVALRATQNLAFFHFIFVDINLDSAFWTPHHVRLPPWKAATLSVRRIIYRSPLQEGRGE
jgi:hypothetical protein